MKGHLFPDFEGELGGKRMSVRLGNCLWRNGLTSVEKLREISDEKFLRLPHVGRATLKEMRRLVPKSAPKKKRGLAKQRAKLMLEMASMRKLVNLEIQGIANALGQHSRHAGQIAEIIGKAVDAVWGYHSSELRLVDLLLDRQRQRVAELEAQVALLVRTAPEPEARVTPTPPEQPEPT